MGTRQRSAAAHHLAAFAVRDRRPGTRGLPVRRLARPRRPAHLAGLAAGTGWIWREPLSALLRLRRKSDAAQHRDPCGKGLASAVGSAEHSPIRAGPCGLRTGRPLEDPPSAPRVSKLPEKPG